MTPAQPSPTAAIESREPASGIMRWFGARSTSIKLFLFMLLFLTPLVLIAILASVSSARANQENRVAASRATAAEGARAVDAVIASNLVLLRAAASALEASGSGACPAALRAVAAAHSRVGPTAIYTTNGRLWCAAGPAPPFVGERDGITLDASGDAGLVVGRGAAGRLVGITRVARSEFVAATAAIAGTPDIGLAIREGPARMILRQPARDADEGLLQASAPLAGDAARLEIALPAAHLTATETLSILLPVLMLLAAVLVAFLVTDRLMLRPLKKLQDAVLAYRAGDRMLVVPHITTPAREIQALAVAFRAVSGTIVRHEQDLEQGLSRQTRLTREVHHRVKNNLQVVASLINLHSRGASSPEVADAYAAIQRRVDALAVVHRNHFAELEENRGVALRPLISELASNLRAGAPPDAAAMPITLDLAPVYTTQDVAVPVAFLITEMVEAAMLRAPTSPLSISLQSREDGRAVLAVRSLALRTPVPGRAGERMERVLQGLSRQLRSAMVRDDETGRIAIDIAVVG